jgi:hypothetical protein
LARLGPARVGSDPDKPFRWPTYAVNARARYRCPFVVLVVTPDAHTARWAAQPVDLGGNMHWQPFVVGPAGIPVITDAAVAKREPHLAVLSAMAHGRDHDVATAVAVAVAAATGADALPEPLRMLCFALIESSLGDAARKSLEMLPQGNRFFSETQRRLLAEGEAKGEARAIARAILRVLERRGLPVSAEQRERIVACSDLATLEIWLDRSVTATDTKDLFTE